MRITAIDGTPQPRTKKRIRVYVAGAWLEPWTGPVERVDSVALRKPCIQLTWRCVNRFCRNWTMNGAHEHGHCNFCQEPRPTAY